MTSLANFAEIWCHDFEYEQPTGGTPDPVCWVAKELRSGRTLRLFREELRSLPARPIPGGPGALHVLYGGTGDWGCFLALGWAIPRCILDLYNEHRLQTNPAVAKRFRQTIYRLGDGLLGAAALRGVDVMTAAEKEAGRALVLRGGPFSADEREAILDYCERDVDATARLLAAMARSIDLPRAVLRGAYIPAVAAMERVGVPIDGPPFRGLRDRWAEFKVRLTREDDALGLFHGASFVEGHLRAHLALRGWWWPELPSGRLALDDETFKAMARRYPEMAGIRKVRQVLAMTRLFTGLSVGPDERNRTHLYPFGTHTGRNSPSNAEYVFGPASWVRGLIRPALGTALAYVDYTSQEFAVAAYLSGDPAMIAAYESGRDVYLAFGERASLDAGRRVLKDSVLGTQYGLGAEGLARKIGRSRTEAAALLAAIRRATPVYQRWSQGAVEAAMALGRLRTRLGWEAQVHPWTKSTSLRNWPIQAHAAEMLRLACVRLVAAGIRVCGPVHDAVLIEAPEDAIDDAVATTQRLLAEAAEDVLGVGRLRSEAQVLRPPGRLLDEGDRPFWDRLMGYLDTEPEPPAPAPARRRRPKTVPLPG